MLILLTRTMYGEGQEDTVYISGQLTDSHAKTCNGRGEADVEREAVQAAAYLSVCGGNDMFTDHNSVLTARIGPERSTVC